jgi:hypothetical protein
LAKLKIFFIGQNPDRGLKDSDPTSLKSMALKMGHSIASNLGDNPDVVICVDWDKASAKHVKRAEILRIPTVLVKNEPSVVAPGHSDARIDSKFGAIVEVGRPNYSPLIRWPQTWNLEHFGNKQRIDRAVAISANKFSFVSGELYSLRARVYSTSDSLDLFGVGWDRSVINNALKLARELQIAVLGRANKITLACLASFRFEPMNFLGQAEDKLEVLSRYKVSVVIENSNEYMSEKLIDSILAGTIPVYVGPPVEMFGIPPDMVVFANPNPQDVTRAITQAGLMSYGDWHEMAARWLAVPETSEIWSAQTVMSQILNIARSIIE